jgi:hypothetical protein
MTAETNTPLQFRQIQDIHERFKSVNPAFDRMTLPEFSSYMEQQTRQPLFEAGKNDNFLMRASAGIDRALETTGIPQASAAVGRGVGSAIGMEKELGDLFGTFPRMTATIAPMILTAPFSLPAAATGLAASAALGGLDAYEKSGGSPTAGLIGAAAVPATLGVARVAGQQALKKMGAPLIDDLFGRSFLAPATTTQKLAQYGAENLGAIAVGEVAGQAQSVASGQGFYNPLDPKNLALMLAGNIPFAALDAQQLLRPLARPNRIATSGEAANVQKEVAARLQSGLDAPVRASEDGGFVVRDPAGRIISLTDDVDEATKVQQFADDLPATNPAEPLGLVRQQGYMDGAFVKRFFADEAEPTGVNRESARTFAFQQVQDTLGRGGKVSYQIENGPTLNITGLRSNQMVTEDGQTIVGLGLYSDAEKGRLVFEQPPSAKFSIPDMSAMDSAYQEAVSRNDTEAMQGIIDDLAQRTGYTYGPVFHGSIDKFTQFDPTRLGAGTGAASAREGFFFASDPELAGEYASVAADMFRRGGNLLTRIDQRFKAEQNVVQAQTLRDLATKETDPVLKAALDLEAQLKEATDLETRRQLKQNADPALREAFREAVATEDPNSPYFNLGSRLLERTPRLQELAGRQGAVEDLTFKYSQDGDMIGDAENVARRGQVVSARLKMENPLVVDLEGDLVSDLQGGFSQTIRDAKAAGHDGVIFKNAQDPAFEWSPERISDLQVVFRPEQIKSSLPITRDDQGNVVLPSRRFNEATQDIRFSLPEDAAKIRQARDAQEALLQYQDTVARATGAAPAIADIKATVSPFLNDWEQRQLGLNNVTPQEAVTRAINVLAGKVDKMAANKKSEESGQDSIDPVLRAAIEGLPLPYQERAASFIRKYGLSELEGQGLDLDPQMREGLLNRMRTLSDRTTDADVKSAIDQEIEYFQQPRDESYDPDLATLLEDYQPYLELGGGSAQGTAKKDRDISDATNLVYAEVFSQFQRGVAPQDIKLSPGLIISRIKTQGVATDLVPSMKYNEATGDWELGRLASKQEAEAFVLKLATDNPDPAVRYQIIQQHTTEGGREVAYFQVRKRENLLQRIVEGYNPDNTAIFRNLGKEGSPADLGDMDLMEFYDNYGARGDTPLSNKGIRGGQQFLADTLHARGMAIADMLPDNAYAPAHRDMAKDRLKVLLELERNREVFRVDKKGKLKDIDHKTIQEAWSQAGGLEIVSTRESDLPRTIRLKVESLMKTFSQAASQDPIMSRLNKNLSEFAQWAREAGPGESPEFFAARRVVTEAATRLQELHKNIGMVVLQDIRDLRGHNKALYDEAIRKGGTAEGYFDKARQEVVLIANNVRQKSGEITLADSMARVLWHEGAGHFGMEKMLGNEYNAIMRGVLRKIDDGARKSIMDTYGLKDPNDLLIAEEYLAIKAETDPGLSLLGETVGALRSYARAFGKFPFGRDPQKLGETGYKLTDNDILYTVKKSRDFTLGKRGLIPGGTVADTQTNTMGDEPSGFGVLGKSDYFSLPAQKLTTTKLADAYNFVASRGLDRGLSPEESNRHAENVVGMLTQRPDSTTMIAQGNGLTMASPLSGRAFFKRSKQFQDSMIRAQETAFLHSSFARAIDSAPETSPVRKSANDYDAWFSSLKIEDIETLRAGLSAIDPDLLLPDGGINSRALAGFIADAYVSKDVYALRELMQAAPAPVANLTKALFKDATAMAESSLSLAQAEALGVTEKRGVGMVQRKALERIYDSFIELRKDDASMLKAEQQFLKMENFQPDRILEALAGGNDMAGPLKTIADGAMFSIPTNVYRPVPDKAPTAPGWISRMFNLPSNIAEDYPEFLPFLRTATAYTALSQQAVADAFQPFGLEIQAGKMVKTENYERFKKTVRSPHMRRAISDLMLRQNEKVEKLTDEDNQAEAAGQPPSMTPGSGRLTADQIRNFRQEIPSLRTLSDNDFQSVAAVFEKMTDSASKMSEVIIRSQASNIANTLRNELATQKGWAGLDEIERAANLAVKYLLDPTTANEWQQNRWTTLSSSDFSEMLAKIDGIYRVPFESFAGYLRKRDGYLPEFRLGQYTVAYKDATTGERKTIGAMDLKDVYAKRKELYENGAAAPGSVEYLSKKASRLESSLLSKGALERAREIEKLTFDQLRTVVGDEVFETQIRPNYEPVTASIHAETQKTMQDYLRRRSLAGGREDLDAIDVLMSYIPAVAYGTARSNVRQTSAFYLKDARIADNEVLRELATTHINNALRASTGSEKVIREAAFQYFMALNPSTMALEMFQSTSSLAPFLTRHGAGFFGSYSELKKSMGQTFQASRNGKFADPELEAMVDRAADEAIISRGLYQELDDPSGGLTEVQDAVIGVENAGRRLGKTYINATRNLYGMTAHFNSRVAFVAGFNRGKKLGMKGEDLYEFARRTTQATMFTGGKGNRAIGLYAGDPSSQPIRAMVGALQSYFQGMVGTMYRYGRESVAKDLPPAQRVAARKAFMQIMGTQLFYAGAMGLPGAAAAVALMEQMFPELELKKNIEEIPKQVLGDTQFGGWMVDSMLYGVPTSSSPIDVSARMGLGQVLGVSSLSGFDTTALFGPFGSIVSNVAAGSAELQEGDLTTAAEKISPVFMKNMIKSLKNGGAVRDYSGNLVTQMTGSQQVLTALGFRPKEIADLQQASSSQKRIARIETRRQSQFLRNQAEALINGDVDTVKQMMMERMQEDPTFDARDNARKVSAKAVDMSFPKEIGRGVNVRAADRIAATTGGRQGPRSSELDRLFARSNFEQALGIPGTGAPTSNRIQKAMELDFLLEQNPTLTVDQAKLILRQREATQQFDGSSLLF